MKTEKRCGKPGHAEYVWPGQSKKGVICGDCIAKLQAIADAMGFTVYLEFNDDVEEKTCEQIIMVEV